MKFAYADPPYLGCAAAHYAHQHEHAHEYDDVKKHSELITRLIDEYDGWALSCASVNLKQLLIYCPPDVRIGAWVKPFASFKPNVNPAYAWEPVIFRGGRKRVRKEPTVRDWVSANITMKKGVSGAKPPAFIAWILEILAVSPEDEFDDLFPGSGAVGEFVSMWRAANYGLVQYGLWESA